MSGKVFNLTGGGGRGRIGVASISIVTAPAKTSYLAGETFDPTGMTIEVTYTNGAKLTTGVFTVTPQIMTDGLTAVTVKYSEAGTSAETRQSVTVIHRLVSIAVTPPAVTAYEYGDTLDTTGMVVTAAYSDGAAAAVTPDSVSPTALETVGTQTVTVTYAENGVSASDTFDVTVARQTIAAVPAQSGTLTYDGTTNTNGSEQTPDWNSAYDTEKMTLAVTAQANAGTYQAYFTPTANYRWADGGTEAKPTDWTIRKKQTPKVEASGSTSHTYDGSGFLPTWSNYGEGYITIGGTTAAQTDASSYSTTFTPMSNFEWTTGDSETVAIDWTIAKAVRAVPAQSGTLTYNGSERTPSWNSAYDSAIMSVAVTPQTNAGTYNAVFSLLDPDNYEWTGGSTADQTATWKINQATGTLTVSKTSITLNTSTTSTTFTIGGNYDGTLSVSSSNTAVATVELNAAKTVATVKSVNNTTGSATITVKCTAGTNYTAPSNKTVNVTAQFVTIYGVEWDWTNGTSTKGTRTDGAAGFSDPSPAVNNGNGSSPFDNLYPWSQMTKETRTGGVMVKEPKYWFKWTITNEGKKVKLQIADGPVDGFHTDPVNMDRGDGLGELDYSYIARYHCANGSYKSETNQAQQVSITRSAARTAIHNLGSNIWQMDFAQMWYVGMLFLVEFADWNGEKIGRGCSASGSKENNGKTDAMQYHTGTTAANRDTYGYTQYRNIEGWWDNVYDWMDGCYYTSSGLNVILNPANFSDNANGTLLGSMPSGGYPNALQVSDISGFEWAVRPLTTGGSNTTCVPDYWNFDGSGPCLRHGGGYSRSQFHGPFCVYYNSASGTYDYIGCRLQELP